MIAGRALRIRGGSNIFRDMIGLLSVVEKPVRKIASTPGSGTDILYDWLAEVSSFFDASIVSCERAWFPAGVFIAERHMSTIAIVLVDNK